MTTTLYWHVGPRTLNTAENVEYVRLSLRERTGKNGPHATFISGRVLPSRAEEIIAALNPELAVVREGLFPE